MEIASRPFWTVIHGMGFGGLFLLLCTGLLVEMYHRFYRNETAEGPLLTTLLVLMSAFAWLAVLTGTYAVYPWYRAVLPAGTTDLTGYPQKLLLAHANTAGWHSIGMEWKEHVAWMVPIVITMAAGVVVRYRNDLRNHPQLRSAVMVAVLCSVAAAGLASFWGAMINKYAPITGGSMVTVMHGESR